MDLGTMDVRRVERELRRKGLSRRDATIIASRGKRWLWIAWISVDLFAHFTIWRM